MPPRQDASTAGGGEPIVPPRVQTSSTEEIKVLKNRPKASKLRQQKLPAWQPILTAFTAIPVVFAIGFIFIPVGVVILLSSISVREINLEYASHCPSPPSNCTVTFNIKEGEDFKGNVYFYYGLDNYFQNHRRYVKSRSDSQLLGDLSNVGKDCDPLKSGKVNGTDMFYAPCGAIANSMFNDTFELVSLRDDKNVPFSINGVIWEIDKDVKFRNPEPKEGGDLCSAFEGYLPPPNWKKHPCELDKENPDNNGFRNVDFIVWMRTAALPSFKKLYRLLDRKQGYESGLPAGSYKLKIENNYPVSDFNGRKHFIISTTSWTGGKNNFLGIAYIVIGCICVMLGAVFSFIHIKFGHSFAEMANISGRREWSSS
ncbi:Protein CBR-CHAT-1 [Aphelenchoides bicaudatus]|nr:Protein CBR-CHAT-1 [Aphelenchoides bicaudatus]